MSSNLTIGPHHLRGQAVLAPMAGVTDRPFRQLCRRFGAALAPAEMLSADQSTWAASKSRFRMDHAGEPSPRVVQLVGNDPEQLAQAARTNVDLGAEIIDINMGCPAKKVCNRAAGSALLSDEALVERILTRVVQAVSVPVTLKIRTGPDPARRNAEDIARIAHRSGVQALAVHGRTRADAFRGQAEHGSCRAVVAAVPLPVMANGDIVDASSARTVLDATGAAAVMIGRGAQGAPWIFRDVDALLARGQTLPPLPRSERAQVILQHLEALYAFYGEHIGVRMARKHLTWYRVGMDDGGAVRHQLMAAADSATQFGIAQRSLYHWIQLPPAASADGEPQRLVG